MESGDEHATESDNESDTDRISELPGDILQKILSSARIRAVVRMRRLSRRWRKLCESLQFIHLHYRDFEHWKVEKFARFVNNLLLVRRKVDLRTFRLHWDPHAPLNCNDVRMWIGYALKHNVKVLDVKLCLYDKTDLPPGIFTCRSLQELNLQWGGAPFRDYEHRGLVLPDRIRLPSLKKLTLRDVEVHEHALNSFIDRSPGLEDLHLIDSAIPAISRECVRIDNCRCTFGGESKFTGELALFGSDIKVMLEKEQPTCSVFESLITLEIGNWCLIEDMSVVLRFLQLSPRLEKLTLMHRSHDKGAETNGMSVDVMTFQCPFLESVTIQCSKDDDGIDKLVNVLVVNGISAEVISIILCEDIKERAHAERIRADEERSKELGIFEKMAKENPEWIDDDPYAMSEPDSEQSEAYSDEYDDDDF